MRLSASIQNLIQKHHSQSPRQQPTPAKKQLTPRDIKERRIEKLIRRCRENSFAALFFFVTAFVFIEDKDQAGTTTGIKRRFLLWPRQVAALRAIYEHRMVIILKARQLGLTWLVLAYAVWRLLFTPGYTVKALSRTEDEAKELVRRVTFILRHLPKWITREKTKELGNFYGPVWESKTLEVIIHHPEGEPSAFRGDDSGPNTARSFTDNLLIIDEWAAQQHAEEIWGSAYPTVNRPTGGQVIGLSTNKRGTLFEEIFIKARKGLNNFYPIFLPWDTDPRRTVAWHEATKRDMPDTWRQEYPATVADALSAGEDTAFPEFSYEIHVCRPFKVPRWWRRWRANDPGYTDPFAWYTLAVSDDGKVFVIREYVRDEKEERVPYSEQARRFAARCVLGEEVGQPEFDENGKPIPEENSFTVVGRDAWNKEKRDGVSTGKSIVDYYGEGGISDCIPPMDDTKTARIVRKAILHEYLKPYFDEQLGRTTAKLQIFSTCTKLIEALPKLVNDEKEPEKVALEPHVYTNPFDALGYALVAWHSKQSTKPLEEKGVIARHKDRLAKNRLGHTYRRALG